ncbi:MAG TPA: molybdopterin converting factor subunit 1 [Thermoanaerobaculia bacterium]|nr:molybdopterin converting factor subunit 1 [Thermoanaerobaculia bacterium]
MRVRLLYFAVLRDIMGTAEAELTLPEGTRPREVWERMRVEHPELADYTQPPLTAINESYASPDAVLREGDELAFIPPVAGG